MGICLIVKSGGGIDTSSANVTADKILSGYTIYSNDNKVTGTMANIGAQTDSGKGVGSSTTIKAGWHDGNGTISTSELKSQMAATTASVGDVLANYTYWSNGSNSRYIGTMTNRGKKTWTIGVNGSQTIEGGWHDGNGAVSQSGVKSDGTWRMLTPKTSQQTLCNGSTYYSQNQWCAGASTLTASNIKKDITIFGVKGTLDSKYYVIKNGVLASGLYWNNFWESWDEDGQSQNNVDFSSAALSKTTDNYVNIDDKWYSDHYIIWIRGVIGKAIAMSSYDTKGKLSGVLCGDFRLGWVKANPILELRIVSGTPVNQKWGLTPPSIIWKMAPTAPISWDVGSSNATISYRQTGVSSRSSSIWFYPGCIQKYATIGDFAITIDSSYWRTPGGGSKPCGQLWCKNLWFDTSATI